MSAIGILRSFAEARCADHEPIPARLTYGTIREVLRIIEEWERSARKPTNETTPDAVERQYQDSDGNPCDLVTLCRREPEWAASRLTFERARHAEEVARLEAVHLSALETIEAWKLASGLECGGDPDGVTPAGMRRYWEGVEADRDSLRDQLRKVEGERDEALRMVDGLRKSEKTARESMVINMRLRDEAQAENVRLKAERDALRSLLPDVRACSEYCRNMIGPPPGMPVEDYPLPPVALAARRILAAIDQKESPTP